MMDITIFIKDRIVALAKDLEQSLNATGEQVLLGLRGAVFDVEKEQADWAAKHANLMRDAAAVGGWLEKTKTTA